MDRIINKEISDKIDELKLELSIPDELPMSGGLKSKDIKYSLVLEIIRNEAPESNWYRIVPMMQNKYTGEEVNFQQNRHFPEDRSIASFLAQRPDCAHIEELSENVFDKYEYFLYDTKMGRITGMNPFGFAKTLDEANSELYERAQELGKYAAKKCGLPLYERTVKICETKEGE